MYSKIKQQIFEVIQPADEGKIASKIFDCFIMFLIAFGVFSSLAITFELSPQMVTFLERVEKVCVVVFMIEYALRIWTADLLYPCDSYGKAIIKYMCSGMAIIDLLAILPCLLPFIFSFNLLGLRMLRLVRLLRLFKLSRYSEALASIADVLQKKSKDIVISFFVVVLLLVIASLLIYHAEHEAQPEQFRNAFSGLWWAVATLTTVGYGDIYPITIIGRFIGVVIALLGVGMVAVPAGIISSGFMEQLHAKKRDKSLEEAGEKYNYCPYCGKRLDRHSSED